MRLLKVSTFNGRSNSSKEDSKEEYASASAQDTSQSEDVIKAPIASGDCYGKDYKEIQELFKNAGFDNVTLESKVQNEGESSLKNGEVIEINVDEKKNFEKGDEISKSSEIVILYCEIKKAAEKTETVTPEPSYTVTAMNATMYAKSDVNVRSGPSTNDTKVGFLPQNSEVAITGTTDTGWYRINYNGTEAFVNAGLIVAEKVVTTPPAEVAPTPAPTPAPDQQQNAAVPAQQPQATAQAPATPQQTAPAAGNNAAAQGAGSPGVIVPSAPDTQGNLVWVPTKGGTKYHSYAGCSGMENPIQVTLEHATANGYTPCKRCH